MTEKRGPGRPRLAESRSKIVGVRFTPTEIAAIESAARSENTPGGQAASEWIRARAIEALGLTP